MEGTNFIQRQTLSINMPAAKQKSTMYNQIIYESSLPLLRQRRDAARRVVDAEERGADVESHGGVRLEGPFRGPAAAAAARRRPGDSRPALDVAQRCAELAQPRAALLSGGRRGHCSSGRHRVVTVRFDGGGRGGGGGGAGGCDASDEFH